MFQIKYTMCEETKGENLHFLCFPSRLDVRPRLSLHNPPSLIHPVKLKTTRFLTKTWGYTLECWKKTFHAIHSGLKYTVFLDSNKDGPVAFELALGSLNDSNSAKRPQRHNIQVDILVNELFYSTLKLFTISIILLALCIV